MLCLLGVRAHAATPAEEIEYLLATVGASNCTFIRNGKSYPAQDAEDHLRMKYGRGRKYVKQAEQFVSRLASKSSMTGKPYRIQCEGEAAVNAADWFRAKLADYRNNPPAES